MGTPETAREPCPDRILDDMGAAFGMGAIGGTGWAFIKGLYNSPKGARYVGASQAARLNGPRYGGSFAVWGGIFSTFDCAFVYLRQKEDPWNSILAGAATGGFLSMRQGLGASARSAAFGGVLLALMEGLGITINKIFTPQQQIPMEDPGLAGYPAGFPGQPMDQPIGAPPYADSARKRWLDALLGLGRKEEPISRGDGGSETKILESFDAPPVPNFEYK